MESQIAIVGKIRSSCVCLSTEVQYVHKVESIQLTTLFNSYDKTTGYTICPLSFRYPH